MATSIGKIYESLQAFYLEEPRRISSPEADYGPPDPIQDGQVYYRTLDRLLEGWADRCGQPDGLAWLRERLNAQSPPMDEQALAWGADADYSRLA